LLSPAPPFRAVCSSFDRRCEEAIGLSVALLGPVKGSPFGDISEGEVSSCWPFVCGCSPLPLTGVKLEGLSSESEFLRATWLLIVKGGTMVTIVAIQSVVIV
jgi:hypothetical protein